MQLGRKFLFVFLTLFITTAVAPKIAHAGCWIYMTMDNGSNDDIQVTLSSKIKYGWYDVKAKFSLDAEDGTSMAIWTDFGCSVKKQYKFKLEKDGKTQTYYYPSSSSYTSDDDFDIGDISRFF